MHMRLISLLSMFADSRQSCLPTVSDVLAATLTEEEHSSEVGQDLSLRILHIFGVVLGMLVVPQRSHYRSAKWPEPQKS